MFRQHGHGSGDDGQFAAFGIGEMYPYMAGIDRLGGDGLQQHAIAGMAFFAQNVEAEHHVVGGDGFAIIPAGVFVEGEDGR